MYINTTSLQYPLSERDLREQNPNISGPMPYPGYAWVFPVPAPSYDAISQFAREVKPVLSSKGTWEQRWELVNLPAEQAAANLERARAARWEAIKAKRDALRFDGGVQVAGHWFLTTAIAQSEYNSLMLLGSGKADEVVLRAAWRTMSGQAVDMTVGLVRQILLAGFAQAAAIDDASRTHKAAMEASSQPGFYDFSGGWPAQYVSP